ncbi:extracellular matrix regulator RemB [Flavonifractor sp. HCP28S3_F3]|uniref:extracellular matrix regulator RemB n=1 Tax=Flavonifractor sp. HCP28S3_F3 TaxID=3438939 RepID=UPI003F8BA95F
MYLHLGQSVVVPYRDVVGIFDLDNTSSSHLTRAFLERAEKEGRVVNVSDDLPRSFVLCTQERGNSTVYLSQLSAATLLRRAESNSFE